MTNLRWIIPIVCLATVLSSVLAQRQTAKAVGTPSVSRNNKKVVCYYTNWSAYRPGQAKFLPQNINPYLCTHLIYAFGGFTNDFTLRPFDKWQDIDQGGYAKFNGLKAHNKNLRTLLAIGGWNEGSGRFSKLVADLETRQNLVRSAIKYLRQHQFDGLDLDWEYPSSREGSRPADRENYAQLVKDLRDGFNNEKGNRERLLLTMAVPAGVDTIELGYDIRALNRDLDFINILSYDYHVASEPQVNHHAPLRARSDFDDVFDPNEELNIDATVQIYLLNGATADKLVLGIPTYGRSFKLASQDVAELGAPADGPAEAGKATREKGYLAYYEICEKIGVENWVVEKPDPEAVGPFAHNGFEWVGYDDEEMAAKKAQYVVDNDLGGIMFWSIDNDDFRGQCTGRKYPLIEAAKAALYGTTLPPLNPINAIEDRKLETSTASTNTLIRPSSLRRPTSNNNDRPSTTTRRTTTQSANQGSDFNPFTTPEPPTTPDSIVDFECKEEGFYPNAKDCKKYFWCLDTAAGMVSHIFTCPAALHFNKFTDSCDYATNVICKTGAGATTTTVKPFIAITSTTTTTTTTTPRPTTTRRSTTTTTTTTPEPETFDYVDEVVPQSLAKNSDSTPEELQQLLQLISDLGGVEAVKQLLEKNTGTGRGRKEDGQSIRLSSSQRQALEKVIRPSSTREQETTTRRSRPNSPQYSILQRRRPGINNQTLKAEEEVAVEELETVSTTARSRLAINIIRTTTEEPQPTAQPQVWRRATYRTSVADSAHPDHLSMTDNDVMQVAMSGHLLVESKLTDPMNFSNDTLNRRFTATTADVDDPSHPSDDYVTSVDDEYEDDEKDGQMSSSLASTVPVPELRQSPASGSDSTSSLEKFFDQQFTNFQMKRLPAVDWSLRSDGHEQIETVVSDDTMTDKDFCSTTTTSSSAIFEDPTNADSADIFGLDEELAYDYIDTNNTESPFTLFDETTSTSTTTTSTTTTTTSPTTTTTRRVVSRRRPLNSRGQSTTTRAPTTTRASPVTERTTRTTSTTPIPRAPIVIAIPAPINRPIGDDFSKRPVVLTTDSSRPIQQLNVTRPRANNQDDITGDAEVFQQGAPVGQSVNGNVVEIDEDGRVFCYDIGNFAYPEDCAKFVHCARGPGRGETEPISGWVHTCPPRLSFDPVGAICNWGSPVRCRQI